MPACGLQIADEFVSDITTVIKVGETVQVSPVASLSLRLFFAREGSIARDFFVELMLVGRACCYSLFHF